MHSSFYSYTVRFGGGGAAAARVFLHYKPKIETSERFEKVWIGDMNAAAAASGHEDERCFQVLLNTVMADISGQVTRRPAQRNGVSSGAAPSERRLQSGAATCSEGLVVKYFHSSSQPHCKLPSCPSKQ